jgi:hypothetical protein
MNAALRVGLLSLVATASFAAPTIEEVGDVDSFGRAIKYLGVKSTPYILLDSVCTPDPQAPDDRCVVIPAPNAPAPIALNEPALATLRLPANAARSLLCFSFQPIGYVYYSNQTAINQPTSFSLRATVSIQSDVFNDPQLIDPTTNAPLNGRIDIPLTLFSEGRTLAAGHYEHKSLTGSRVCTGGLISRSVLVDGYGLSNLQAAQFFARPITLSFGLAVNARTVEYAYLAYGTRIYGD